MHMARRGPSRATAAGAITVEAVKTPYSSALEACTSCWSETSVLTRLATVLKAEKTKKKPALMR